jgi:hypothetical protein
LLGFPELNCWQTRCSTHGGTSALLESIESICLHSDMREVRNRMYRVLEDSDFNDPCKILQVLYDDGQERVNLGKAITVIKSVSLSPKINM